MTNQLAIILACVIVGFFAVDLVFLSGETSLFLAKKFLELIEWVAFWR